MSLLLEAVVGFGLLSTCMLLIFGIFPTAYSLSMANKDRAVALSLAKDKIEELRVGGFTDPQNTAPNPPGLLTAYGTPRNLGSVFCPVTIKGQKLVTEYTLSYTVSELGGAGSPVKRIQVDVTWLVGNAGSATDFQRRVTLETYVSKH